MVTGSSGFIGSALVPAVRRRGDVTTALVRRAPRTPFEAAWDPGRGEVDADALGGVDAVVHLAGVGIGSRRWSDKHKARILESRVKSTAFLARTLADLDAPPATLVSASAVGYYGDGGDRELTESSPPGTGFLSEVVQNWERAAEPARAAGVRVVHPRSGIVLARHGGVLPLQLIPFRLGLGGRIGSGRQYVSWITLRDEISALLHLIDAAELSGPVNLTAPNPVTNAEFARSVARVLRRPAAIPVPPAILRVVLGSQMAEELLLFGQRAVPTRLEASGFTWEDPELESALRQTLGEPQAARG